ncbi:unnamed protein product [Bursaphelenchus okinawaensis]|uniref:Potassium channel domain-containing protein n=1 Tax=Bursaphelenchus okinawaensis TaxID=465554 RepID=A0A811L5I4_9BILA|nr:unnamed protein product [Bursaphelenchus okinawaensis]CAG9118048.1 unnamed protein product [Bursaphelenchus okinawaensis]
MLHLPASYNAQRRSLIAQDHAHYSLPRSRVGSFIDEISEISAERLNLYVDRNDTNTHGIDNTDDDVPPGVTFPEEPKTPREKLKQKFKMIYPHVGLVVLSAVYTVLGAAIFHHLEGPFELHIRNATATRVQLLKNRIITQLWTMAKEIPHAAHLDSGQNTTLPWPPGDEGFQQWAEVANTGMNLVIKDVFIDYTKNYLTPEDIINGTGPNKWSFGASIFFSWTAITTIGYGHIVPRTLAGRVSCLLYALFGIPLILVTIADIGRFLSTGIIWVHNALRRLRIGCFVRLKRCCRFCCCCFRFRRKKGKTDRTIKNANKSLSNGGTIRAENHLGGGRFVRTRLQQPDNVSDAGTFEDVSEIPTQEGTSSEDTHARADEIDEFAELQQERRVSVLFILFIMLGYTAGGACLMQLWEQWSFVDAFYFCAVTVTTIGFGDIVPQNSDFLPATLTYIVIGLIITTMCIDLVGTEYIRDIHFYGRSLGRSFLTIGGKVVHLGEVFSYVAFLQKNYGLTPEQLDKLAQLPDEYLLDCMINGKQPDLNWVGGKPFIPPDIYYFKWIEHPRTLSYASERVLASMESLDLNTSRCSTARTLTPREYYQRILMHYCKQMQQSQPPPGVTQMLQNQNAGNQSGSGRLHQQNNLNSLPTETLLYGNHRPSMSDRTTAIFALPS